MRSLYDEVAVPPVKHQPKLFVELFAFELREHGSAAQNFDVSTAVAAAYKAKCYEAAQILLDAAEALKEHLKFVTPRPRQYSPPLLTDRLSVLASDVMPALAGIGMVSIVLWLKHIGGF